MILGIVLGAIGLACLFFEFFLPGGLLAILGALILIISVALFIQAAPSLIMGVFYFLALGLGACLVCAAALWWIRKSSRHDTFFLQKDQEGYVAPGLDLNMIGKEGTTMTELKPAGYVRIGGIAYQAVSDGSYVHKDVDIEVISVRGGHLLVKEKTMRNQ